MDYSIALIIGRFQPFHLGHLYLIKKALEKADKIIIGIGSANITDVNNPIDFETRKKVIKAVAYKEKFENRLSKIVPLNDFFNDKKWLDNLKKQIGNFDIALGNNDWTNNILEKTGYKIFKVKYYKRLLCEGWRIRKLIKEEKNPPSLKLRRAKWQDRVPKYLINIIKRELQVANYSQVIVGGTFDHFHKGHEALLKKAFTTGKKVFVGIATKELYKDKFLSETVESFEARKKFVSEFLKKKGWLLRTKLISFSHFTGGADKEKKIEAIIVSKLTYSNVLKINQLRKTNKLPLLKTIFVRDVLAEDGKLISSERIRTGEIDRNGKLFKIQSPKSKIQEIIMPESLREELRKPLGKIFKNEKSLLRCIDPACRQAGTSKHVLIIAIGDIIVDSLLKSGIDPDVKIIDFRSRRKRTDLFVKLKHIQKGPSLYNNPGTINFKTAEIIKEKIKLALYKKQRSWIVIEGEEDLLALPAILYAPLNSLVLYGHWQLGIIVVEVDEKMKDKVKNILTKFI